MNLLLISVHYPPIKSSCAVQMRDLALQLKSSGHNPVVLVPEDNINDAYKKEVISGITVYRLKCNKVMNINFFQRAINEIFLPLFMLRALRRTDLDIKIFNGVIWYSPTIFFGPLISYIKKTAKIKSYLILRDVFPEWAYDLGIIKKGMTYYLFKLIAKYQYSVANTIGVQTESNKKYFLDWKKNNKKRKLEVLNNWLAKPIIKKSSIQIKDTILNNKKILVYIGNMGVAQDMPILINLAETFNSNNNVGFLFVGRGTKVSELKQLAKNKALKNILFYDEIDSYEIFDLLKQCHVGMVALDPKHKSHNIPGKFLTYMQAGIPVLARINQDTDLENIILQNKVGRVYTKSDLVEFNEITKQLLNDISINNMSKNCEDLYMKSYTAHKAACRIINSFETMN